MNRFVPVALVATAVAVMLLIGIGALMRPSPDIGTTDGTTPTQVLTPSSSATEPFAPEAVGDWIAYSTAPADDTELEMPGSSDPNFSTGSDIYLAHEGVEPRLVAGRGEEMSWNLCPAFSPDGAMLAFGTLSSSGRAVRIVGITRTGEIVAPDLELELDQGTIAPCPRWSSDGRRVAYLEEGTVIVRGLDGSTLSSAEGDPTVEDFRRYPGSLPSPDGALTARIEITGAACPLVVEPTDGSGEQRVVAICSYALAAWSPDGRQVLHMRDISGRDFSIQATSIEEPFETTVIVGRVAINHSLSWPGYGDVSWQPNDE